ncbi:MAG: hypothetical protein FK731_06575 [Asgard group archaeon]|nr:hypothetical protein [Asgard group archaeon]
MKYSKYLLIIFLSTLFLPSLIISSTFPTSTQGYAEDVKIGFTAINGLIGASEMTDMGYAKAKEMGCQIEHREYRWDFLNLTLTPILEWDQLYLNRYPEFSKSLALSIISSNSSALPIDYNFQSYTNASEAIVRFNDTAVVEPLKKFANLLIGGMELDYVSFGNEINGFFETYFDYETETMNNTVMLMDYIDLCEQMYDFVKTNYSDTKVLTIFRYQPPIDLINIEAIISLFNNTCDIFAISSRIFTDNFGYLTQLDESGVLERYSSFANLTSKKIAITNTYTISDSRAGSSEYYQASFVKHLFNFIELYDDKLEFVCWYSIFDYPPGYLSAYFSPFLEVHATAGLFTPTGDPKMSSFAWLDEMQAAGRLPNYWKTWKIAVGSLVIAAVIGFVIFVYVMEGLPEFKKKIEDEEKESKEKVEISPKETKRRKEKKPKTIEFTSEGIGKNQESTDIEKINDDIENSE